MKLTSWKQWAVGSAVALTIMAGGLLNADSVSAAPAEVEASVLEADRRDWHNGDPGERSMGERNEVVQSLLAEALGIEVEELESAQQAARDRAAEEALDQAVDEGRLTEQQAEALAELKQHFDGAFRGRMRMMAGDRSGYLAEELGISVEELEAARDSALQAALDQAVAEGMLSPEQADDLRALRNLAEYLADELEGVVAEAVQQAVTDGIITQNQADRFLQRIDGYRSLGHWGLHGMLDGEFDNGRNGWSHRDGHPGARGLLPRYHGQSD